MASGSPQVRGAVALKIWKSKDQNTPQLLWVLLRVVAPEVISSSRHVQGALTEQSQPESVLYHTQKGCRDSTLPVGSRNWFWYDLFNHHIRHIRCLQESLNMAASCIADQQLTCSSVTGCRASVLDCEPQWVPPLTTKSCLCMLCHAVQELRLCVGQNIVGTCVHVTAS